MPITVMAMKLRDLLKAHDIPTIAEFRRRTGLSNSTPGICGMAARTSAFTWRAAYPSGSTSRMSPSWSWSASGRRRPVHPGALANGHRLPYRRTTLRPRRRRRHDHPNL